MATATATAAPAAVTTVSARIDADLKRQAEKVLGTLGISHSTAINALYAQIVLQQGIPFELRVPEKPTPATLSFYEIRDAVRSCAERYGLERAFLFGSYARGDAGPQSDVDLAVDKGDARGFALGGFQYDVSQMLGCKVDVVVRSAMEEPLKSNVARDEVLLYER
jgi:addiction module RelB/DinJ family antitoxin